MKNLDTFALEISEELPLLIASVNGGTFKSSRTIKRRFCVRLGFLVLWYAKEPMHHS